MSAPKKETRLNLPIGRLKKVLVEDFGLSVPEHLGTAEIEELALSKASRDELTQRVALVSKNKTAQATASIDQENNGMGSRRDTFGDCVTTQTAASNMTTGRTISQDDSNRDDELFEGCSRNTRMFDSHMRAGNANNLRSLDYCDPVRFPRDSVETAPINHKYVQRLRSIDSCYTRSLSSAEANTRHNDIMPEHEVRPCSQVVTYSSVQTARSPRCSDSTSYVPWGCSISKRYHADDWNAMTPANDSAVAETPLLRPGACSRTDKTNFAPSHFHSRGLRSVARSSGPADCGKVMHTSHKCNAPRIIEHAHESDAGSSARYVTPATGRHVNSGNHFQQHSRCGVLTKGYARQSLSAQRGSSCRPCDAVPFNPNPAFPSPLGEDANEGAADQTARSIDLKKYLKVLWRCRYPILLVTVGVWLFGLPNPFAISAFSTFSSLLPSSKSTGNLPTFCSMRRGEMKDCAPCPRRALCYEGRAECPTYYALEKITAQEWECKSYRDELERIAHEGFSRVVSYLRKIEKPADCGAQVVSNPESRRDVLHLFDNILLPMLDERQKGLKDGLLQMYLTLLADEDRLRNLRVEKEGGLHVTLASVMSKSRLMCYLPANSQSLSIILLVGVIGLVYLNSWLK